MGQSSRLSDSMSVLYYLIKDLPAIFISSATPLEKRFYLKKKLSAFFFRGKLGVGQDTADTLYVERTQGTVMLHVSCRYLYSDAACLLQVQ